MNNFEQDAVPLSKEDSFSYESEDPQQVCSYLKKRIFYFITNIELIQKNSLIIENASFLEQFADNLIALHALTQCSQACSEPLQEVGFLIDNILTCPILIKRLNHEISTLDAAKSYRKNQNNIEPFSALLKAYTNKTSHLDSLLNELKLLAYELIEQKENI